MTDAHKALIRAQVSLCALNRKWSLFWEKRDRARRPAIGLADLAQADAHIQSCIATLRAVQAGRR